MKPKFFLRAILLAALLSGVTAACQKQKPADIHDTVVIRTQLTDKSPAAAKAGGTDQITIFATCDWELDGEEWFTITPSSGTRGISESTITTTENTTGADRTGTVRLKAGSYTGTYTFTQITK